jgi:hypothetical protein
MNKEVFPQSVDFNYKVRCSQHNLKPYVYCEMCMVRTELQGIKEETMRQVRFTLAQTSLAISEIHDILTLHRKQIDELQIEIKLLKAKNA